MAGGQQATSGQGSVTQSESLAIAGLAITGGAGTIVADNGGGIGVSGAAASASAGAAAGALLVGLRSRKVGGGEASRALSGTASALASGILVKAPSSLLSGASASHSQGALGKTRAVAPSGSSVSLTAGVVSTATTYLAAQAEALLPGYWTELTGFNGFNWNLIESPDGSVNSILDFANKGCNDIPGGRIQFVGGAHPGKTGAIVYTKSTNTWARFTPHYSADLSHAWDGETYEPSTGDMYAYQKTSGRFWRRLSGATSWTEIATHSGIGLEENIALTWDETRVGLIAWTDANGASFWAKNAGTGSWTTIGDPGTAGPYHMSANYMRVTGECFLGDGDNNPTRYWLLNSSNTFTSGTAPVNVASSGSAGNLSTYCFDSERLLIVNPRSNNMRSFNPLTRLWRQFVPSNGAIPMNRPTGGLDCFAVSLEELGCILYIIGQGNGANPKAYLYRHTTAPIVPSSVTFTGSHDMTQYVEDWNASTMSLRIQGTLPSQITFNGTSLISTGTATASGVELVVTYL